MTDLFFFSSGKLLNHFLLYTVIHLLNSQRVDANEAGRGLTAAALRYFHTSLKYHRSSPGCNRCKLLSK